MPLSAAHERVALLLVVGLVACSDAPSGPRPTTPLRLCSDAPFVAYQNEGGRWTYVAGDGGQFSIEATERVGFAFAWPDRELPYLVVEYHSAEQAATMHPCGGSPPVEPPRTVQGVVRARSVPGTVIVAYGAAKAYVANGDSGFKLPPGDAGDLAAVNLPAAQHPNMAVDRVILQHGQALVAGARVELDFTSTDAFPPEMHALRWTGEAGGVVVTFGKRSDEGIFLGVVYDLDSDAERAITVPMVPAARTAPGDLHHLALHGDGRDVVLHTRAPDDVISLRFGPKAGAPILRNVAGSRYRRLVAEIPSHPDYDASVGLYLSQNWPNSTSIMLTATREYFGGRPATWRLPIPDFSGVPEFPVIVAPKVGALNWTMSLSSRPGPMYWQGSVPTDGQVVRTTLSVGIQD